MQREFNPTIAAPADILRSIKELRRAPSQHIAKIDETLALTAAELRVLSAIENPGQGAKHRIAYASRAIELLNQERYAWHPASTDAQTARHSEDVY